MDTGEAVLLFDGECGFCRASIQFILRRERQHTLRFATLQSRFGIATLARHPALQCVDSVVWLEPGHGSSPELAFTRSEAALRVMAYLGGWWRMTRFARVLPRRWRDAGYDLVARHRRQMPAPTPSCLLPAPAEKERFIS